MVLRKNWPGVIEGRLIRSNGMPGPAGIHLTLIRVENPDGKEVSSASFDQSTSNEQGEYSFRNVAPGRYRIVMNLYRFPTARAPYPKIYWPAARAESEALIAEITDGVAQQKYDFRLPPEPKSTVVNGIVLSSGGTPAPGAAVYIEALPDNTMDGGDENTPQADAAGRFSFTAFEGFEYRLSAASSGELHSADLTFSLRQGTQFISILLERPAEPARQ